MRFEEVITRLEALGDPGELAGMARFGIVTDRAYGVRVPELRKLAKVIGKDHPLALELWAEGSREARIIAALVADLKQVDDALLEAWARDFDSWEVCDQCCMNLFDRLPVAYEKAVQWCRRDEEFVRRAGFALMACLAMHDKKAPDEKFLPFFTEIASAAGDGRNFVKKAVNWALRQTGKRSLFLNEKALEAAREIQKQDSRSARWIAADAIRELESEAVGKRLRGKGK
jgi:3-methyladenine DNA glycosylase AlkD